MDKIIEVMEQLEVRLRATFSNDPATLQKLLNLLDEGHQALQDVE